MKQQQEKKTIIIGYKEIGQYKIPIIQTEWRTDFPFGVKFYCDFCKKVHTHGEGAGHRAAHCHNQNSPYGNSGYILQLPIVPNPILNEANQ
jgi:hypothetical protein